MSADRIPLTLKDIELNLNLCQEFLEGVSLTTFLEQTLLQYAVVRAMEVVGEATKRLPEDFRTQHPEIPWKKMAGMRDRIVHGYDSIDWELAYATAKNDAADLLPRIRVLQNN